MIVEQGNYKYNQLKIQNYKQQQYIIALQRQRDESSYDLKGCKSECNRSFTDPLYQKLLLNAVEFKSRIQSLNKEKFHTEQQLNEYKQAMTTFMKKEKILRDNNDELTRKVTDSSSKKREFEQVQQEPENKDNARLNKFEGLKQTVIDQKKQIQALNHMIDGKQRYIDLLKLYRQKRECQVNGFNAYSRSSRWVKTMHPCSSCNQMKSRNEFNKDQYKRM